MGTEHQIADPTKEEWSAAFHAPSNPYLWTGGDDRVTTQKPRLYMVECNGMHKQVEANADGTVTVPVGEGPTVICSVEEFNYKNKRYMGGNK